MLTAWKRDPDTDWLTEPSKGPLQAALRHLQAAFVNYWDKRGDYPTFKKKDKAGDSATYDRGGFTYRDGRVKLAKQSEPLNIRWSRTLPPGSNPSQVSVSKDSADRRRDHLHKLSTRLVRENQVIVIEDLAVRNMVKNRSLSRAISDASWSQLARHLEYKADWYGRTVIAIDRWYPSSTTCSGCGHLLRSLPLNVRQWACPACGVCHDRDVNAAKNIRAAGLAVQACGDGVRPPRS